MKGDLADRTRRFAIEIIRLVESLPHSQTSGIIGIQLIRATSSVGANYRSASRGRSRADFVSKIAIVEEEVHEVSYWLELLHELRLIQDTRYEPLAREAKAPTAIFVTSAKTAERNAMSQKN